MRRRWQGIAVAVVVAMGAAGVAPAAAVGSAGRPANVQFRPVLAELPALTVGSSEPLTDAGETVQSCDVAAVLALASVPTSGTNRAGECVVMETGPPGEDGRLYLGPIALDGGAVKRATSIRNGGQHVVELMLTHAGRRRMNQFAADAYPEPPPKNQMAILVDGVVVAAPTFQEASFTGGIQFSGDFTAAEAEDTARRINASRWLSRLCTASAPQSVPESYVGSNRHVADLRALERGAPSGVGSDVAVVRKYVAEHVDPVRRNSQLVDRWPPNVQSARDRISSYARAHCR